MDKFFLLLFFFISSSVFAQMPDNKMAWEEQKRLNWENFNGKPDPASHFHANASTGFAFSWYLESSANKNEFNYEVKSYFYPENSWVKKGTETDHLLAHEQLHFDISELYARKFRKIVKGIKADENIKENLQSLYQKTERERHQMQEKFDLESRHSENREAEEKWQHFIKLELENLEEFSD